MHRVGVDIGGTFTDVISFDEDSDALNVGKVPTTPADPSVGLTNGLDAVDVPPKSISSLLHGTTVTTNAVLEREGPECGLITTEGFRDILEIGWRDRPSLWGLEGTYEPLIPRTLAREVAERMDADGEVRTAPDPEEVRETGRQLLEGGAEAVVVSFLHSYVNPENERRAVEALEEVWPNDYVVRTSEVLPEFREFERTSTTALTAYTQPVISKYLDRLEERLASDGFDGELQILQSNGGLASVETTKKRSGATLLSGPAGGATASSYLADVTGDENIITCDMGGTSFDVALLPGGDPVMTQNTDIEYQLPIRLPMMDITTIGAGGGSIAKVDEGGILQVGPESAGADPGPVCYGRGGEDITITDVNLVLQRLNPDNPIEEGLEFDLETTRSILEDEIAAELDLSVEDAASAVIAVGINKMVGKIRELSVEQGYDPREFSLVTFGGAGPLHAAELIEKSDVPRAIVPYNPGILSALGCALADIRYDYVRSVKDTIEDLSLEEFHATIEEYTDQGTRLIEESPSETTAIETIYRSDMKYEGQTHSVSVPIPSASPTREELEAQFEETYAKQYSEAVDKPVLIDNVQVSVVGVTDNPDLKDFVSGAADSLEDALKEHREVYFDEDWYDCPIYERMTLPLETSFKGPAVLEQPDTTTVINPGMHCRVDEYGNVILETEDGR